jgi:hypothetical protein
MTFSDSIPKSSTQAIGLHWLIEELGLDVVVPAVRSEVVRGARKTRIANGVTTTMNVYGKGMMDSKLEAHTKLLEYARVGLSGVVGEPALESSC